MDKYQKKVSIVISIYKPNLQYLEKQLLSINSQTYKNIEVIVWDDYENSDFTSETIGKYITKFPYKYIKCQKNLGYIKAFEKLTTIAEGDYISYCDQDDIWEKDKILKSVETLINENAVLVTSDYSIIDGEDKLIHRSAREYSPAKHNLWHTGDDITKFAMFRCYAVGFTIVIDSTVAKKLVPFPTEIIHDKWLALGASALGKVAMIDEPLARYRRHGKNESGTLSGIYCKKDYYEKRVYSSFKAVEIFINKFPECKDKKEIMEFAIARKNKKIFKIWKYRRLANTEAKFEILLCFVPNFIFKLLLNRMKRITT